tara:strand:- start:129 stop:833 length:705 start_codon:yes stop_codon:yes gene_type:complete
MFNANGLSPFRGEINRFIIPVFYFKEYSAKIKKQQPTDVLEPAKHNETDKNEQTVPKKTQLVKKTDNFVPPKINIIKSKRKEGGVSSLSLSSIKMKKEAERKLYSKKMAINEAEDTFNQEKLSILWKTYIQEKNNLGENNIAALLELSQPKLLDNHKILLKSSSDLNKVELTKESTSLMAYLNKSLNNYKITFEINVEIQKREEHIYGIKEKYEYLKKINPEIEVLRKEFDLEF